MTASELSTCPGLLVHVSADIWSRGSHSISLIVFLGALLELVHPSILSGPPHLTGPFLSCQSGTRRWLGQACLWGLLSPPPTLNPVGHGVLALSPCPSASESPVWRPFSGSPLLSCDNGKWSVLCGWSVLLLLLVSVGKALWSVPCLQQGADGSGSASGLGSLPPVPTLPC